MIYSLRSTIGKLKIYIKDRTNISFQGGQSRIMSFERTFYFVGLGFFCMFFVSFVFVFGKENF